MKMTTGIPKSVSTPDQIETRLGTLRFVDGFPTEETSQMIYDHLDFQRAVESVLMTVPGASLHGMRRGLRQWGPDNGTACIWEDRMDSKVLLLTPNTTVVYVMMWLDTKDGPIVIETPPNVLGIIDNFWFNYVTDFGNAGPDRGEGGKYVLVPPSYDASELDKIKKTVDGAHIVKSKTFGNWLIMRGFLTKGDPKPAVDNMKAHFALYPLAKVEDPPVVNWVNVSGKEFNTIHSTDFTYFEEINDIVQEEPNAAQSPEILGLLAAIGIEKGKPFAPDARMKKILEEAAAVGTAACRSIVYRSRVEGVRAYPDSEWENGFPAGSHEFLRDGVRLLDQRVRFHYYATGITPAMVVPMVNKGSQYMPGMRDSQGRPLEGSKNYKLHIPPEVPCLNFWDVTMYDVQTRSLLQTDQQFPGLGSESKGLEKNSDGSYDIYFGPEPPAGKEGNWLQTIPGKLWHTLWRVYSPTQVWFDKSWKPGEFELIQS